MASSDLSKTILEVMNEKNPSNAEQLAKLVKAKLPHEKTDRIIAFVELLQRRGMLKFEKVKLQSPTSFTDYLTRSQSLWYRTIVVTTVTAAIIVFLVPEDYYPWTFARNIIGTIFVLWLPGYSLIRTLFPQKTSPNAPTETIDKIERIALSIGISLAIVPLVGLLLNYTPWGIRLVPIVISLLVVTLLLATIAALREYSLMSKIKP